MSTRLSHPKLRTTALDPAERDRIIQAALDARDQERTARAQAMDDADVMCRRGRPRLSPPPATAAQMILADRRKGMPVNAIWRKYGSFFSFSRRTLARWLADGTLEHAAASA